MDGLNRFLLEFFSLLIHLGKSAGSQDNAFRPFRGTVPDSLGSRRRRQYDDGLVDIFRQILDRRINPAPQNFAAFGIDQIQSTFEPIGQNVLLKSKGRVKSFGPKIRTPTP